MAQNIILKRSATPGKIPTTASLSLGELAINSYDGKAFLVQSGSEHKVLTLLATDQNGNINYTGSLSLTASYATQALSASLASTASFVLNAVSSSFATTASHASNGGVTQLLAGPNISLSPTTGVGQVTISSTGGGSSFNTATGSYGSFYDTTTQTNVAGTARSMSLNTTDISNGVSISGSTNPFNTYIKTENAGVYNIQFSAQVDKTDSGTDEIWIWLRKNGTNLTDTATSLQLVGNGAHYVAAWNFFVNAAANDYFQLMWYSPDASVRLHAESAFGVVPGIPSLIVTANRVDQFLSNTGSFSGSFTGQFTGSLLGTATTSSFASTASYVNPLRQIVEVTGSIRTTGSLFLIGQGTFTQTTPTAPELSDFFLIRNATTTFKVTAGAQITSSAQTPLTVVDNSLNTLLTVSQSGLIQVMAHATPPTASAPEGAFWFTNDDLYISLSN